MMTTNPLPIFEVLDEIQQTVAAHPLTLLEAPPGTGKTTVVPAALLDALPPDKQIWVLEPRRIAARWTSQWVARQRGEELGQSVGYQVRNDARVGKATRLIFMTQGVFSRRLLDTPRLQGVGLVILDEFHERSLDGDLALAWLRRPEVQASGVRTLIMSATLPADLAERLGNPPVVRCQSPIHPVAVGYDPTPVALEQKVAAGVRYSRGSGLVFLPGMREIRRCATALEGPAKQTGALVQILHGSQSSQDQDRVLTAPANLLRWVLTTNLAETSLTVPGVSWVIDSGLARTPVHAPGSTLSRLEVQRISQFSARQRAGRAGRTGPGQCLRLYGENDFRSRNEAEVPEILRSELSDLVLHLAMLGGPELDWLDAPPAAAWATAEKLLRALGALQGGKLTEAGRAMARLPLEPRLARLLLGQPTPEGVAAAAWLARGGDAAQPDLDAYLADPSRRPLPEERSLARNAAAGWGLPDLDAALLAAYPDRVAQVRRGRDLVLCDGSGYRLSQPLEDGWLLALQLELEEARQVRLSAFARIEPEWLLERPELNEVKRPSWNAGAERVEEDTELRYGELSLEASHRRAQPSPEVAALLEKHARESSWWRECQAHHAAWGARAHWARTLDANLPELPDLDAWLKFQCESRTSLEQLRSLRWQDAVAGRLRRAVSEWCPDTVPLGRRTARIHYEPGQPPWLESRLVDFFGLTQGPQLAGGRIPLTLHLLAPNNRPVQITSDLAGFWERHYAKVRSELARRYPRHPWPADPLHPEAEELKPKKRT